MDELDGLEKFLIGLISFTIGTLTSALFIFVALINDGFIAEKHLHSSLFIGVIVVCSMVVIALSTIVINFMPLPSERRGTK